MYPHDIPVPHLTTANQRKPCLIEDLLLKNVSRIESWFRAQWTKTKAPLTSSVDLRRSGLKLAPVDTNLFPAGFNNLNPDFLPLCIQAAQSILFEKMPTCKNLLLIPENHTRNRFYAESLARLSQIFTAAGFDVRIGNIDESIKKTVIFPVSKSQSLLIEPMFREEGRLMLKDFSPCLIILNNDLSSGIPPILEGVQQPILPSLALGWAHRKKSIHFQYYDDVVSAFQTLLGIDSWLINPLFSAVEPVDFMKQSGLDSIAREVDKLLQKIGKKYEAYGISDTPFVVVKADSGTYGMNVMSVMDGSQFLALNRKMRTRMAVGKGGQKVEGVLLQEGVYSDETMSDGAVCEPVVYMIGPYVVGGFYRVHRERLAHENLNAPGMHFEPLAFAEPCNMPRGDLAPEAFINRFYAYGVVARLAALAAAKEIQKAGGRA